MSGYMLPVDMAGGANVLRCFADFITSRPGLPALVSVRVTWSHIVRGWEIQGQLPTGAAAAEVERWAIALDDAVVTSEEGESPFVGRFVQHAVNGTVHGHAVHVWATERRADA